MSLSLSWACKSQKTTEANYQVKKEPIYRIQDYKQREGDADAGYEYLIYGDYVGNGIPYDIFVKAFKAKPDTILNRTGDNATIPFPFTAFTNKQGVKVVSGNCLTCHAGPFNGEIVLGLGNTLVDYTTNMKPFMKLLNWRVRTKYGKESQEWKSFEEQATWFNAMAAAIKMENPGINPAFRIEESVAAYRDPIDLTVLEEPVYEISSKSIGTDVPPLWGAKKKKALYYGGMGRGDFSKHLMQACMLGIHDSTAAREVQKHFQDVWAWIETLEAPAYPKEYDNGLALEGKKVFEANCSKCHGKYGKYPSYPNKIVPLDEIKTDPVYVLHGANSGLYDWYQKSWFHTTEPRADGIVSYGYIAPPLDGIWATSPYLHNGSIPTLEALLDSKKRPTFWKRSMEDDDYDYQAIGWNYEEVNSGKGKNTYDTTIPGYTNKGHYFGDSLSVQERTAVIEYLKTL